MANYPQQQEQEQDRAGITMKLADEEVAGDEQGDRLLSTDVFYRVNIGGDGHDQFPPPITLLGQMVDDILRFLTPWEFHRSTDHDRLLITMYRLRCHEFLRAHRSDGRLRLTLVYLVDSTATSNPPQEPAGSFQDSPDGSDAAGAAPLLPSAAGGHLDGTAHRSGVEISDGQDDQAAADAWGGIEQSKNVTLGFTAGACSITSSSLHLHVPTMGPIHS